MRQQGGENEWQRSRCLNVLQQQCANKVENFQKDFEEKEDDNLAVFIAASAKMIHTTVNVGIDSTKKTVLQAFRSCKAE